jgi:RNA polymerase sigma-70 factor (ECF subfamily)
MALPPQRPDFRMLFETELGFVWNSLRRFGVPDRDCEDVAHEVFLVVNRRIDDYDPKRPIRPWLYAIAFRCASEWRRLSRNRNETLGADREPETAEDEGEIPEQIAQRNQEQNLARRALLCVPELRRVVLILHDFEEVAMHDVAEALGIPLKTAYSRLRIARSELIEAGRRERGSEETA